METIPYGRQLIGPEDVAAVTAVLRSDFLTQGPVVPEFERAVASRCSVGHAVAVNSATSALHIACLALGLGPGDTAWTSPNTFVASANCVLYCGAEIDFVDIDPHTYNLSTVALAAKLDRAERVGRLPKVVIPVHFAGQSCDMRTIHELARRYGFRIIEDASHAIGGSYLDASVGNCRYSDITVFSFHPVKIITTGEGGMALTRDPDLAKRMASLRSHGITRDPADMVGLGAGPWYYEQTDLGFNYRMTDIQAALGLSQLARLDEFIERRRSLARRYDERLSGLPLITPSQIPEARSALHLYPIRLDREHCPRSRGEVFGRLRNSGIAANVHYIPVPTQPFFEKRGFRVGEFPQAEAYYAQAISLPLFAGMSLDQQDQVIAAVERAVNP